MPILLVAACGGPGSSAPTSVPLALARIRQAVARTEAAGTAHLVETSDTRSALGATSAQPITEVALTVVGDIRFAGPDLSLTTTSRSVLPAQTSNTVGTSSSLTIYVGRHLYLGIPPGPQWAEAPYRTPYAYLGAVTTRTLETARGPVTDVGSREVDGQPATGYLVPVPSSVGTVPLTDSHNQPYTERFTFAPFTLSVWLDGTGRIVRTSGTVVVTSSKDAGTVREETTTILSAFGEPVHIVAPAVALRS